MKNLIKESLKRRLGTLTHAANLICQVFGSGNRFWRTEIVLSSNSSSLVRLKITTIQLTISHSEQSDSQSHSCVTFLISDLRCHFVPAITFAQLRPVDHENDKTNNWLRPMHFFSIIVELPMNAVANDITTNIPTPAGQSTEVMNGARRECTSTLFSLICFPFRGIQLTFRIRTKCENRIAINHFRRKLT